MEMTHCRLCSFNNLFTFFIAFYFLVPSAHSKAPLIGVHPLDEKYFSSRLIKCKDGSKSFPRDSLNDNFCDCVDGTDEPGTSACPRGKFYCQNLGSKPQFIFSSHVNDRICDCCDGSDEYDSGINCPNTCIMGGNLEYKARRFISATDAKESEDGLLLEDLLHKAKGLKMVIILQGVLLGCVVIFQLFRRRRKLKRMHYH
ncbi:hypothetical protein JCGZ_12226 [Jatropha curcas]|uniref:Glucosidase II beta subunit N-terminal domain-containing protein n=1 Tax=Jatropha curcas TaxID=180498 RepID=A0A067KHP5_JATCU|nr:glucosidase 2 subunit beta [Jatropha curcas]XP_012079030.1 glucosidase 2 subunit beta [Jatropha curcas]KDP31765.1 hypothetical protein JCGZ_12226 [Jatropha curcas]